MEDFNALAAALAAGITDVRGCLMLSRDGLILGVYPEGGEQAAKPAWLRMAAIADFERGFLQSGTELWCYVRRGPYASFVLTGHGVRPGLVIEQMEQALLAADEARSRREGLTAAEAPAPPAAPSGRPRAPLHPEPRRADEPVVVSTEAAVVGLPRGEAPLPTPGPDPAADRPSFLDPVGTQAVHEPPSERANPPETEPDGDLPEGADVDPFSLAREFSQLLQDDGGSADA